MSDPILSRAANPSKNDILIFKNETLKDFKEAQKKISDKYKNLDLEIKEKLESYEKRINTYENKIIELSNLINTDKTIRDKVETLMEFKEKVDDKMLTEKIRLDNCRNDLNSNIDRIDQILKDSVIYPGVIGGISKYKTFHDLIDYVLTQCSQNLTFREKSILDFKGYKTKLENIIGSFNTQINTLLNTTSEYTKTSVKELEDKIKSIFNVYDDRLQDTRIENANYAIGLERATEALKKELENLEIIKKELYEKVDSGILEVKNDNTRVVKLFAGYKRNFHVIQHKFNQLSDFIKDIRFRINLKEDVKRREYSHMSDLINFDKKKKPGFYDGVYDYNIIKKGLASQLKDYIEGKIKADQLFKRKNDLSKSLNITHNAFKRKNILEQNNREEVKLSFVDLFKSSLSKSISLESQDMKKTKKSNKKEIIKEEEDENYNSSKELNSIFYKTVKETKIDNNLLEKELEKPKEDKKKLQNKTVDKKDNINDPKKEESKIQIIAKDKDNDKNNKQNDINPKEPTRPNIKKVINNLFNVKNIIENIKNIKNESPYKEKNENQNDKIKNNNSNIKNNNENVIANDTKDETNKNNKQNKNNKRPTTEIKNKRNNNEQNPIKDNNNIGIIANNELLNEQNKNRIFSGQINRKIENQGPRIVSVNIYNATINSLGQPMETFNFKPSGKKKANSTNQKENKYYLKQNKINHGKRGWAQKRKEETKTIENMFNNLNNYVPRNDINVEENSYFGLKKKK